MPTTTDPIIFAVNFVSRYWPIILFIFVWQPIYWVWIHPKIVRKYSKPSTRTRYQKELSILLHGDKDRAKRIISQLRNLHPGKSEQWLYEKAILDLERDRRY